MKTNDRRISELENRSVEDFPDGVVVTNLPSQAGDVGSIPGGEAKIPHGRGTKPICHNEDQCSQKKKEQEKK